MSLDGNLKLSLKKITNHLPLFITILILIFFGLTINDLAANKLKFNQNNAIKSLEDAKVLELKNIKSTVKIADLIFQKNNQILQNQQDLKINKKSKLILINFFASWCSGCRSEHQILFKLRNELIKDVVFIGVAWRDLPESTTKFLETYRNPYDLVLMDGKNRIGNVFGVNGVPETFIINNEGRILYHLVAELDSDNILAILQVISKYNHENL